jgi:CTP synthase
MKRYIVVTGGVVSGIGKGITSASIGVLLKEAGFSVDAAKFDPYLNVDPGTMSPFEHGEVYVLEDGSETDLDLGHYERFLDVNLTKESSVTSGKIYQSILNKERNGDFLGRNVQLIPHVTNHIQEMFTQGPRVDVRLIEIGGSTGDIEQEIYLESVRQFKQKEGENMLHVHLGYIPFLACSGEYKTKPFQNSLRELLRAGIQPDLLVARYEPRDGRTLPSSVIAKLSLYSNLPEHRVLELPDLPDICDVPTYLLSHGAEKSLSEFMNQPLDITLPTYYTQQSFNKYIRIGLVTKYTTLDDSYLSVIESIRIAGKKHNTKITIEFVDAEKLQQNDEETWALLRSMDGIIVPGGFGKRGLEGKVNAIADAKKNKQPFLGICLGLQMAVVANAREAGLDAVSREMLHDESNGEGKAIVIDYMPEQNSGIPKGGTMRLGGYRCEIKPDTLAYSLYQKPETLERHRHRLEVQGQYLDQIASTGLHASGYHTLENGNKLVEIVELDQSIHPYFIATQSHPEFLSRPDKPHPLFEGLIQASINKVDV